MSSTRRIKTNFKNNTIASAKVEPTKALLVGSMDCEKRAAHIFNETIDSIEKNNTREVIRRFKQSQKGEAASIFEASSYSLALPILLILIQQLYDKTQETHSASSLSVFFENACLFFIYVLAISTAYISSCIPPSIANAFRYHEAKNKSDNWLKSRLGNKTMVQLRAIESSKVDEFCNDLQATGEVEIPKIRH